MMRLCLSLLALTLLGAGCKSGSFVDRRYDNFTAYYNTFYNAQKSLKSGLQALERREQPIERGRYLPLFTLQDQATAGKADFDAAVLKSADVLRKHGESKWADDALMVIGKSYFYQKNYVGSRQKFDEVIEIGSPLADEARFWLARSLIASANYEDAAAHLEESLAREDIGAKWAAMYRLALGELYVKRAEWEAAATALAAGVARVEDKQLKGRALFLLGQVYENLGRYDEAIASYQQVQRTNPLYQLSYAAQFNAIRVQGLHGNPTLALQALRKMERDDKHFENLTELTYLRGRIYQAEGRLDDAFDIYDELLYNDDPTTNAGNIRGEIHYALGVLYRDGYNDFIMAAAHFDTASSALRLPANATVAPGMNRQALFTTQAITDSQDLAEMFGSFAEVYENINLLDSLLWLGSLDPAAFDAKVLEMRQALAEEMEAQRRAREKQEIEQAIQSSGNDVRGFNRGVPEGKVVPGFNDAGLGGGSVAGFLYHKDQVRVQEGKVNFTTKWGRRPLVPNWRRLEAIQTAANGEGEGTGTEEMVAQTDNPLGELPEIDVSAVPRDSTSKAKMRHERANARYELGNVLFLAVNRPDSAAAWYRAVIEEDTEYPVAQRAFYALAEVQLALGDSLAANRLYEQILEAYPDSDFSVKVRERLGVDRLLVEVPDTLEMADQWYARTYVAWDRGRYSAALDSMLMLAHTFPVEDMVPKALLAAGRIYGDWVQEDSLDLFGPIPTSVPDSVLASMGVIRPVSPAVVISADSSAALPALMDTTQADVTGQGGAAVSDDEQEPAPERSVAELTPGVNPTAPPSANSSHAPLPNGASPLDTGEVTNTEDSSQTHPAPAPTAYQPLQLREIYQYVADTYARTPFGKRAKALLDALDDHLAALHAPPDTSLAEADSLMQTALAKTTSDTAQDVSAGAGADSLAGIRAFLAEGLARTDSVKQALDVDESTPPDENLEALLGRGMNQAMLDEMPAMARAQLMQQGILNEEEGTDSPPTPVEDEVEDPPLEGDVLDARAVDSEPELIGGMQLLQQKFRYPEDAGERNLKGPVFLEFVVNTQGRVVQPKVVRGLGAGCDVEALRVIRSAKYIPGQKEGTPVNVRLTLSMVCGAMER